LISIYPKRDGPKRDGPKRDGPKRDGPKRDGPKRDGPKRDGPKRDGPKRDGPKGDDPKGDDPKGNELTLLTQITGVTNTNNKLPFTLLELGVLFLAVSGKIVTSDKLAATVTHRTVLVKMPTHSLVGLSSKLGVCTHSINIVFTDGVVNCWLELLLLLLCHLLLSSNCIPGNNHFLRFLFLLLQLFFLRHT